MEITLDKYRGYIIEEVFRYSNGTSDWSFHKDGSERMHSAKEKTLLWVCKHIDDMIEEIEEDEKGDDFHKAAQQLRDYGIDPY